MTITDIPCLNLSVAVVFSEASPHYRLYRLPSILLRESTIQPGHISAQLHRGIGGSNTFINYAIWESTEHVKKAADNANLQGHTSNYPANTVISIHLFKKIAIPGICVE